MALPVNGSTLLISRPTKDERLSWPSWLTCSGRFTHINGHPSAAGRAQDKESSPVRDRRSTTVPRHQLPLSLNSIYSVYWRKPGRDRHTTRCNSFVSVVSQLRRCLAVAGCYKNGDQRRTTGPCGSRRTFR